MATMNGSDFQLSSTTWEAMPARAIADADVRSVG
jgi:hypothetical protein